jgi:Bacterial pre-peptidase C-terminal domain
MSARRGVGLLAIVALASCEPGAVDPGVRTSLSLQIAMAPGLAAAADAGMVRLEGPTNRTLPLSPGQTQTIDNLPPGSYTVSLEALVGGTSGQVVSFGQTTVTVVAGHDSPANITLTSFVPTGLTVPGEVVATNPLTVSFNGVQWAASYVVQVADNAQFTNATSQEVTGTSATLTLDTSGDYYVRVFARDRFGSNGVPATAAQVTASPPATPLQDGVPLGDRTGAQGSLTYYTFQVPAGPANRVLQIRLRGGTGNADLAIRLGSNPTPTTFDCASVGRPGIDYSNSLDFCSVLNPDAGTWHIAIKGTSDYTGVVLDANILPYKTLASGTSVGPLSGDVSDILYYEIAVPSGGAAAPVGSRAVFSGSDLPGASKGGSSLAHGSTPATSSGPQAVAGNLHLALTGGTGDVDLLVSPRTTPFGLSTVGAWPCVSKGDANEEVCDIGDPDAGPWTVILLSFAGFSGVTLRGQFAPPPPTPPTIANPVSTIIQVNDSATCSNGGTFRSLTFDYQDPNGDVADTVDIKDAYSFQPSGTAGTLTSPVAVDGNGFSGTVTVGLCTVWGSATQATDVLSITDKAGLQSNTLTVVTPRPAGANAPTREPPTTAPPRVRGGSGR